MAGQIEVNSFNISLAKSVTFKLYVFPSKNLSTKVMGFIDQLLTETKVLLVLKLIEELSLSLELILSRKNVNYYNNPNELTVIPLAFKITVNR